MSAAIRAALRTVAELREDTAAVAEALKIKRAAFAAENQALLEHEKLMRGALEIAEDTARSLVLVEYQETQDPKPVPGVEVKLFTTYTYDPAVAFSWAKEKDLAIIPAKLDAAAFEKIAKATPLSFVTIGKEARVTLATKLDLELLSIPEEAQDVEAPAA